MAYLHLHASGGAFHKIESRTDGGVEVFKHAVRLLSLAVLGPQVECDDGPIEVAGVVLGLVVRGIVHHVHHAGEYAVGRYEYRIDAVADDSADGRIRIQYCADVLADPHQSFLSRWLMVL